MSDRFRTAEQWISALKLRPHPEGGHYRELHRSRRNLPGDVLAATHAGERALYTTICFLLARGETSKLHVLKSDEIWFHHHGAAVILTAIDPQGALTHHRLGSNPNLGESLQVLIPAGHLFGAELFEEAKEDYAVSGCMVCPGFDFADFSMPPRSRLLGSFPQHEETIRRLARPDG